MKIVISEEAFDKAKEIFGEYNTETYGDMFTRSLFIFLLKIPAVFDVYDEANWYSITNYLSEIMKHKKTVPYADIRLPSVEDFTQVVDMFGYEDPLKSRLIEDYSKAIEGTV